MYSKTIIYIGFSKTVHLLMHGYIATWLATCIYNIIISLGMLVSNSRDRQGKLWFLKKQKMALKTILQ